VCASRYAVTTHASRSTPPSSPTIVGSAVATIVWSSAPSSITSRRPPKTIRTSRRESCGCAGIWLRVEIITMDGPARAGRGLPGRARLPPGARLRKFGAPRGVIRGGVGGGRRRRPPASRCPEPASGRGRLRSPSRRNARAAVPYQNRYDEHHRNPPDGGAGLGAGRARGERAGSERAGSERAGRRRAPVARRASGPGGAGRPRGAGGRGVALARGGAALRAAVPGAAGAAESHLLGRGRAREPVVQAPGVDRPAADHSSGDPGRPQRAGRPDALR